jgi:uncharacterized protein
MERNLDKSLLIWSRKSHHKPLLLRGARQTGKTYAVHRLGLSFSSFIEINFEREPRFGRLFEGDLQVDKIIREIEALRGVTITAGATLLFFDEIQLCPRAVVALRYFFETIPGLHVVGAGSLLDFELKSISVPVGRIEFMYVRPLTFAEYVRAAGRESLWAAIGEASPDRPLGGLLHEDAIALLREYLYIGGMPGVIARFLQSKSIAEAEDEQRSIVQTYRADFAKYSGRTGIELAEKVFSAIPAMVGGKTVFSQIDPEARAHQIKAALDLLIMARVIIRVRNSSGAGVPLAAGASEKHYKCIFLDVGLMQRLLETRYESWWRSQNIFDHHRGAVAEQFVGQELLLRNGDSDDPGLFFWHRSSRGSQAEVDYLCETESSAVPIEVKSNATGRLKSMRMFLAAYPSAPFGIKCSLDNFGRTGNISNVPLYAMDAVRKLIRPDQDNREKAQK